MANSTCICPENFQRTREPLWSKSRGQQNIDSTSWGQVSTTTHVHTYDQITMQECETKQHCKSTTLILEKTGMTQIESGGDVEGVMFGNMYNFKDFKIWKNKKIKLNTEKKT